MKTKTKITCPHEWASQFVDCYYFGDVNLEYGGMFYNFSPWKCGYVDCVRITEWEEYQGDGVVMIERGSINVPTNPYPTSFAESHDLVIEGSFECVEDFMGACRELILVDPCFATGWEGKVINSDDLLGYVAPMVITELGLSQWSANEKPLTKA